MDYTGRKVRLTGPVYEQMPIEERQCTVIGYEADSEIMLRVQNSKGAVYNPFSPDTQLGECELIEETNQEALDRLQLQPGDIVRVVGDDNNGNGWTPLMEKCKGQLQEVKQIEYDAVKLKIPDTTYSYWYRPQILEVVSRAAITQQPMSTETLVQQNNHTILDTAKSLIYGDREKEYGKATDNIGNIAKMWSILLQKEITSEQVLECMIAVKQCRLINQPNHTDSWIDICGYAALKEKIDKGL